MDIITKLLFGLFICSASFNSSGDTKKEYFEHFNISPSICIVDQDSACDVEFMFDWTHNIPSKSCLLNNSKSSTLICMDDIAKSFSYKQRLTLNQTTTFEVKNTFSKEKIDKKVLVQEIGKDVRALKRRLWSIF